jgi:hypothetical protein
MLRIGELGQFRTGNDYDMYNVTQAILEKDGQRPPLFPTDTLPMENEEAHQNPGYYQLLKAGEITELTPHGAQSVLVFPGSVPAPDITTDISYEDVYPRNQHVTIFRGGSPGQYKTNPWGPFPKPPIGPALTGLGQPEEAPILFYENPDEVAFQTYNGPMYKKGPELVGLEGPDGFSSDMSLLQAAVAVGVGGALGLYAHTLVKDKSTKLTISYAGGFVAAVGILNMITSLIKK